MTTTRLLYLGKGIPVIFWITLLICGLLLPEYSHLSNLVSQLGAVGTETQLLFSVGLLVCSILSVLFVIGLYRTCRQVGLSTIPVLLILFYSFSIAGAAVFPLPLRLHSIFGMPSVLLVLSPLLSLILWKDGVLPSTFRAMTLLCFLVMSLGFLSFMPDVLGSYPGLKQRFFHIGWSVWFVYLSYSFTRLSNNQKRTICY